MSNRMGVLSRRLQRFAVGFSFATFAFFLTGLFAVTKHSEDQVVFFLAGLVSVCLFATIFLWLAHGFAWAMIPEEPAEAKKPAESLKPAEAMGPADAMKAAEPKRPAEAIKAVEEKKPADAMKEAMKEAMRPAEAKRPAEAMKAAEEKKPAEAMKAAEEKKPEEAKRLAEAMRPAEAMKAAKEKVNAPKDPPDAKYTITGRRIS